VEYAKRYYAKRAERYDTSAAIGSKSVWWLLRKAMAEDDIELFEEVMAAADAFADPWNPNWYVRYASYLSGKGRQQAARDMFERTVVEYPTSLRAVFNLAQFYEQTGEKLVARDMYQTAVQLAEAQGSSQLENIKSKLKAIQ
jgi:tetratricopeptide (TPR) repeat protein